MTVTLTLTVSSADGNAVELWHHETRLRPAVRRDHLVKKNMKSERTAEPDWKTRWPRNGDLATWFRCMLQKCDAIPDDATAADQAELPIEHLAEMGREAEAIRWVNRFLKRLPLAEVLTTVQMALVGAKISLDAGNLRRMEKYLAVAESTEPFNTRKCDRGFSINRVRRFRAENGILDPEDAVDREQRIEAEFWAAKRRFDEALAAHNRKAAYVAIDEMEQSAAKPERERKRQIYLHFVVLSYAAMKDAAAVKRRLRKLSIEDRDSILDTSTLIHLGMKREAVARAKKDIAEELKTLSEMDNPNIHFPAMAISRSLQFLFKQGETTAAKRWLRRALKEMPTWPALEYGWTTSAVYHTLAEATAVIEGPQAAEQLIEQALADGRLESRAGFRKSAVNAALDLKANIDGLDETIEEARKIRSPTQRRKELGKLLARAQRWKELREMLSQVASPEEAADVAWWIKFELPGGEVR